MPPVKGSVRKATTWVLVVAVAYAGALLWFDRDKYIQAQLAELKMPLVGALVVVFLTYVIRYYRWRYLLLRQGASFPDHYGFLAYLSGFALTVTPGKIGELMRIRYYRQRGVAPECTLGVFVFERALDLLVILLLSLFAAALAPSFGTLAIAVLTFVAALFVAALWPASRRMLTGFAARLPGKPLRQLVAFLLRGVDELGRFLRPAEGLVGMLTGTLAWLLTSIIFVGIVHAIGLDLPWPVALGIYPLAMLVGALSFVPGGVGTTELAIVLMLGQFGVEARDATAAAVGVRLVTLWFAVAVGILAILLLELRLSRAGRGGPLSL